jgi:hypothetical protein
MIGGGKGREGWRGYRKGGVEGVKEGRGGGGRPTDLHDAAGEERGLVVPAPRRGCAARGAHALKGQRVVAHLEAVGTQLETLASGMERAFRNQEQRG